MKYFSPLFLRFLALGFLMLGRTVLADVYINEFMASNGTTLADEDGSYQDWIELYNSGSEAVDLSGWGLSDNEGKPFKWQFPEGVEIDAGGYLVVWASGKDREPGGALPGIRREVWFNIGGNGISDLIHHSSYPDHPSRLEVITDFFEAPTNSGDNYGQRMQGVLTAPATGFYQFWIASDDEGQLWLSSDETVANVVQIAHVPGHTGSREWEKYPSQKSAQIWLLAGQKYAMYALMKEGAGEDNLAVRWKLPNGQIEEPIPASHFSGPLAEQYHTNFKISVDGEPLVLTRPDGTIEDFVPAVYVPRDISRGRLADGGSEWHYFSTVTVGAANTGTPVTLPPNLTFSEPRGYKDEPFETEILADDPAAVIRYTLDGSVPNQSSPLYTGPLTISSTTTLRASAVQPGMIELPPATITYLFLEDVLQQSSVTPAGWPADRAVHNHVMRYGMRPEIVNNDGQRLREGMMDIPSVSLVTDLGHLFASEDGIYSNSNRTYGREVPVSIEVIDPNRGDEGEFHIDGGLRLRGAYSRSPDNPKHSFRLFFRSAYGDKELNFPLFEDEGADKFSKVDLMTTQNYSWARENSSKNTFIREVFSRDTQRDMGMPYTRSRYYHLYLNGQYWGLYMTQERGEADFASTYLGGESDDWDTIKTGQPGYVTGAIDGSLANYHSLHDIAVNQGFTGSNVDNYWRVLGMNPDGSRNPDYPVYVDEENLINYVLITHFTGDQDAPIAMGGGFANNLSVIFNRKNPDGFKWLRHDAEHSLGATGHGVDWNPTNGGSNINAVKDFNPLTLHWKLSSHPEYRMRFADLVQRHLYGDGALTAESSQGRVESRMAEIDLAIIGESARWGQGRTRDATWIPACNEMLSYINQRGSYLIDYYREKNWFPDTLAPVIAAVGSDVRLSAENTFYYMLDGSDPRLVGGGVHPDAILVEGVGSGVSEQVLIPGKAEWRYYDAGTEPPIERGREWTDLNYRDVNWEQGPAILGFAGVTPTNPVATPTKRYVNGSSGRQVTTTYLRHEFFVESLDEDTELIVEILRDDGAVVYLNGVEILRENMPSGTIGYDTYAASIVGGTDHTTYHKRYLAVTDLLRRGRNVLAVSLHQVNATSSDLYFDLSLKAVNPRPVMAEVPLHMGTAIKARALNGGEWSALAEFSSEGLLEEKGIHYWDFEDLVNWQQPTSTWGGGELSISPGAGTEYLRYDAAQGFEDAHLRVNDPLGSTLHFALPTTGHGAIRLSYETRRSGMGAGQQLLEYTVDGVNWAVLDEYAVADSGPQLKEYSLGHLAGVNDNPNFAVRITFAQAGGGDAGNNRFDNVTLSGVLLPDANLPPEVVEAPEYLALVEDQGVGIVDVSTVFVDPNGDELSVSVSVVPEDVVAVALVGSELIVTPLKAGEASVTLRADDGQLETEVSFVTLVYPRAHVLADGAFEFGSWSADEVAGAFPDHMIFLQSEESDSKVDTPLLRAYHIPAVDAAAPEDVGFPYAASSRTRINGLDEDGIAFINTGRGRDVGGALLALDTRGLTPGQGRIHFTVGTVLPNNRVYALGLQYRIGVEGEFADFLDESGQPVVYLRDEVAGHESDFDELILPVGLLDQPYLQLLWRYYHVEGDSGSRAQLRLDDIVVELGTEPTLYAQWQAAQFPDAGDRTNPAISGPLADPAGSGISNLLRYAYGLDLDEAGVGANPALTNGGREYRFRYSSEKTDLVWRVRLSTDLEDWSEVLFDSELETITVSEDGWASVTVPDDPNGERPRVFVRLEVSLK